MAGNEDQPIAPQPQKQPVQVQIPGFDFNRLMSLGEKFLENKQATEIEGLRLSDLENERQYKLESKGMDYEYKFTFSVFRFLAVLIGVSFILAIYLIVWTEHANFGFLIISHISTLVLGLFGGIGLDKAKRKITKEVVEE